MLTAHAKSFLSRVKEGVGGPQKHLPTTSTVAMLLQHGGFQVLITPGKFVKRLKKHAADSSEMDAAATAIAMQTVAEHFFCKLCPYVYYAIPSSLMSHLAFPHEGRTYTEPTAPERENPSVPAVFTFVGQFVDHDLTFNGLNLFDDQSNLTETEISGPNIATRKVVPDFASPAIDLDSVYSRTYPNAPGDQTLRNLLATEGPKKIYNGCKFHLHKLGPNAYDLPRFEDASEPNRVGSAWIYDPRNEDNQIVTQIHILLMRVHNKLMDKYLHDNPGACPTGDDDASVQQRLDTIDQVRKQVVHLWQSVVLNDFLCRICKEEVMNAIMAPGYTFHYGPDPGTGTFRMPHEFAIAYRFGHSMLRSAYKLNNYDAIALFNNRDIERKGDLRGGRPLQMSHVIDWDVFYPADEFFASRSLKIDSRVTHVVFDLPESTIPDDVKTDGNLPKRNLERSRAIQVGSGEEIARCLNSTAIPITVLKPHEVEPDDLTHYMFRADVNVYKDENGHRTVVVQEPFKGYKDTTFKTPLWYYVLREAELTESGQRLGTLGSVITGEVIVQAIRNGPYAYGNSADEVLLEGKKGSEIKLRDLIDFVHEP